MTTNQQPQPGSPASARQASPSDYCQVAVLTPPGRGAVASIVVDGPHASAMVERLFRATASRPLRDQPWNRIVVGRWQAPPDLAAGVPGEELVVTCRHHDYVEVHCHGGAASVQAIVDSLVSQGCRLVPAAEWLQRQEPDQLVADARLALAQARTMRAASILLDQYHGVLSRAVQRTLAALAAGQVEVASQRLQQLLAWSPIGERLIRPWQIALVGQVNVGKSSLINALLGYQRALVDHEGGTTRDVVTELTAIAGWPVELADTAGLRKAQTTIEIEGMRRARQRAAAADLVLIVSDASQPWQCDDQQWPRGPGRGSMLIHNKTDLARTSLVDRPPGIGTSALTGEGIPELIEAVSRALVPIDPPPGTPMPFLPSQTQRLVRSLEAIHNGVPTLAHQILDQLLSARPVAH